MRKLIVEEWLSLDGYAADQAGKLDFFPSSDSNKFADEDQLKFMDSIDTILLGRITYELFVDFWPTASTDKEIIADKLNATHKMIFSNTLQSAPWGTWPGAQIVNGSAADAVRKLKAVNGKNMVLWGSISLAQSLMKENLVDEYHLQICPTAVGGGRSFFPETLSYSNYNLVDIKKYDTGVMFLHYEPRR
ncbi:MAG TPA: dihydrofolate reductase family protein [Chryseolinea sp.]|nr:dihydrofolate reductase family protein [Chryseolinea sp.]